MDMTKTSQPEAPNGQWAVDRLKINKHLLKILCTPRQRLIAKHLYGKRSIYGIGSQLSSVQCLSFIQSEITPERHRKLVTNMLKKRVAAEPESKVELQQLQLSKPSGINLM